MPYTPSRGASDENRKGAKTGAAKTGKETVGAHRQERTDIRKNETMATPATEPSEKRLDRAAGHVNTHWFPVNPSVLATVRQGLEDGAYDLDISFLIQELKSDFALFTYCVKELVSAGVKEGISPAILSHPIKLLRWGGTTRLKTILCGDKHPPKSHIFRSPEDFQGDRLRETAIAASTAQLLSEQQHLDSDTAFCHGVVRQVGLNLIAWNYPTLYSRVLRRLAPDTTLEEELSKALGFSPSMLAMRLLRPNMNPRDPASEDIRASWEAYDILCEVGEALARASSPETYPSAEQDWQLAHSYVTETLGLDGVELIKRRALENTKQYQKSLPTTFGVLQNLNPEEELRKLRKSVRTRENPYLKQCPPHVQAALSALYADMPLQRVDRSLIERLLKQITLQAGFSGGCIFVLDPAKMSLVPRATFGKIRGRRPAAVALPAGMGDAQSPLIAENMAAVSRPPTDLACAAFTCEQPLIERSEAELLGTVAGIYNSIGKQRKIGVLYLEAPEWELDDANQLVIKSFKAIRQALCDALMVN